eukprot:1672228-Rhodomonas_salina.1
MLWALVSRLRLAETHTTRTLPAQIGAFPFTTITPNLGQAFFTAPLPPGAQDIAANATPSWGCAGVRRCAPLNGCDCQG